ncbi:putative transcriptional regulator, PucR family [Natranaerobius thermophilus JW/NM-WN-LF]|uniref:Putative transcriptional regulator, PucR family n=1 Tax=Natranaerobius thermophilus (strain ATCC BAA-1301 / DSM 18059 / JW/NM-WN-LF) TaxID=457570 RepID=B2A0W3_NATTJ|nr:putative transcriptional regulator, PucR family [Natranaerobius thermophilus JW/NM-WN-LF]
MCIVHYNERREGEIFVELTFETVYNALAKEFSDNGLWSHLETPREICGIKFIDPNGTDYQEHVLYIGDINTLEQASKLPDNTNLLLISRGDGEERQEDFRFREDAQSLQRIEKTDNTNIIIVHSKEKQDISGEIFNFIQDLFIGNYKMMNNSAELLNSLIKGRGLKYVVKIGTKILNKPIVLIDSSFKVLAHSENRPVQDPLWNNYIANGYCSYEFIQTVKHNQTLQKLNKNNTPQLITCEASQGLKMVKNIKIKDKIAGYVIIFEDEGSFSKEDSKLISQLSNVLAEEMKKHDYYKNSTGLMYENLLLDLLDDNISSEQTVRARVQNTPCSFGENLYLIAISLGQNLPNHYCVDYYREQVKTMFPHCKAIYYQDYLLVLLDLPEEKMGKEILDKLINFLENNGLWAAVSDKFSSIMEFKRQFLKVKNTLEFGQLLLKGKKDSSANMNQDTDKLLFYESYKPYDLISTFNGQTDLMDYCHSGVIELQFYDQENGTAYLRCLQEYLNTNQNINEAAEKLYIHRNTMRNRISKIIDMTELNLENSQTIFHLQLSLLILEYLRKAT